LAAWDDIERALEESEREKEKMRSKYSKFKQIFDDGLVKQNIHGNYEIGPRPKLTRTYQAGEDHQEEKKDDDCCRC